jgi:hypothetical protein
MPWKASGDTPVNGVASKLDDVRESLSKEADRLAEMAAQYSRDAGAHAAGIADDATTQAAKLGRSATERAQTIARDPAESANNWLSSLVKGAAGLATAFALAGRRTADDLGTSAQSVAKDLRNVRITTEPKKTGPDFMPGITLLAGFGTGIALMYFLDPERGRARRNMLRDKVMAFGRQASKTAGGTAKDLGNRAQGAIVEARKQVMPSNGDGSTDLNGDGDHLSSMGAGTAEQLAATDTSTTDTWGTHPQQPSQQESGASY